MSKRHDIRRLAMQVLYQLDLRGQADAEAIRSGLDTDGGHDGPDVHEPGFLLATQAWEHRHACDSLVAELAPQWPTHRQPPVDRAILRLAYYEMAAQIVPVKVAINEAVELAKEYGSAQSFAFVNGVLDKLVKHLPEVPLPKPDSSTDAGQAILSGDATSRGISDALGAIVTKDPWLADALRNPTPPRHAPDASDTPSPQPPCDER